MYPVRSASVVARSAMDGSWAVTSQRSVLNPFGSFRHDGSFPASLISGSVTSRHLGEPPSDYSTSYAPSSMLEDSTHLYINMIERSDIGAVKSTKFWNDSDSDSDDNTSEFSSIHADDDEDYDIVDDHRGNADFCSPLPCDVTKSRGTPVQVSLKAIQRLAGKPPMAPRHIKINTASRQNQSDQPRRQSSLVHKVGPWLQNIAHHSPDVVTPATHKVLVECSMSSVPSSFATESYTSQDDHVTTSFDDHTNTLTDQSCHSECRTSLPGLPMDTLYHSHQIDVTRCQPEYSVDSDATFFMHQPLTSCGIARPKLSKRRGFTRQLKKIGRFFSKTSRGTSK